VRMSFWDVTPLDSLIVLAMTAGSCGLS
jgi:hypothetical protein